MPAWRTLIPLTSFGTILFFPQPVLAEEPAAAITFGTLVEEVVDLERLTRWPKPGFRLINLSSFDRSSDLPAGPGWFNNSDFSGNTGFDKVPQEPGPDGIGTYLLCDLEGPGTIARSFTVGIFGTWRVWLDDQPEPIFEGRPALFIQVPYVPFLERLRVKDPKKYELYHKLGGYFPIPFAKDCRMEWTGHLPECHVYQFGIRLYEPGTNVVTFHPQDLLTYEATVQGVLEILEDPARRLPTPPERNEHPVDLRVDPRQWSES
ncbi:MAG: hypothetical protein RMJ16_07735 [Thermoguttaceae bacterium]|nr:hypothetical protein [Thermoguttaceae bacterium]